MAAPAAARSFAFQAAPGLPPASTARRPCSFTKTGRTASGSRPAGCVSTGLRGKLTGDDPSQFGNAGAAIGARAQGRADGLRAGRGAGHDRLADDVEADPET